VFSEEKAQAYEIAIYRSLFMTELTTTHRDGEIPAGAIVPS
jgi:hypothetical protein